MGVIKKLLFTLFLLLLVFGGLYVYSLSQVTVKNVSVDDLEDLSFSGFTVGGDIDVYNGGLLPVGVNHIEYRVVLESSNRELANGIIRGKTIYPKETVAFRFSNVINWIPTSEVAKGLISSGNTYARIEGTVYVADLKFIDFKVPFETRINLDYYIEAFVKKKMEEVVEKTVNTISRVGSGIKNVANSVVNGISDLFN